MAVGQELLVVSPLTVLENIFALIRTASFWQNILLSFVRIFSGYLLGVVVGCLLAYLTTSLKFLDELFRPILMLIKSTPVASFIILALVWIKKDYIPIFIVFLIVLPVMWSNVREGILSTDKEYLEMARIFHFSKFKQLKAIYFHSILPFFTAGATTTLGLAWKSGVAAEVLAMPVKSIGYNLYRSKITLETADLFAWTAVVIILSTVLEKIISHLIRKHSGRRTHDKNK
ncbi:MAG: ABC transporter permease subunit [Faecalibacterium sp.]|nr:ABC transporter permease subunit [Ruminococcus sp.]MCM1392023.1 ABC transporter permease subunit [Ruminococcus sp.]MCM1484830.1 ABC transporter permease subunit [Faecalibacterium sp.]